MTSTAAHNDEGIHHFIQALAELDLLYQRDGQTILFSNLCPTRVGKFYSVYLRDPKDPYTRGNFVGQLFEMYVTNLILTLAKKYPSIHWVIPNCQLLAKQELRKNALAYSPEGNIILYRGIYAYQEFDAILKVESEIVLIEMKAANKQNFDPDDYPLYRAKFNGAFEVDPFILLIIPSERYKDKIELLSKADPRFKALILPGFDKFVNWAMNNYGSIPIFNPQKMPKISSPRNQFSLKIPFDQAEFRVRQSFSDFKLSKEQFWKEVGNSINLVSKFPIGLIKSIDVLEDFLPSNSKIRSYLQEGNLLAVYVLIDENRFTLEVVACKHKPGKYPSLNKSKFAWKSMSFANFYKKIGVSSFYYHQVKQISKNPQTTILDKDQFRAYLERCRMLYS